MNKKELLETIKEFYITSGDFNGLPGYNMKEYDPELLIELLNDEMIEVISENETINPHIKGFSMNIPKKQQIRNILNYKERSCFYPTAKALKDFQCDYNQPYKALLQKGVPKFKIVYFEIGILQIYIDNPKYTVADNGYKGHITLKDEYYSDDSLYNEYLKMYGMAYKRNDKKIKRAVASFVGDLAELSPSAQTRWKSYEQQNQDDYVVEEGFVKNAILGEWVTKHWIMDALLEEMVVINNQCNSIGIPNLFRKTYNTANFEKPDGFSTLLLPTQKNYYDFISVLEKLLVHNIDINTFLKASLLIHPIDRKDEDGNNKGSLVMFKEWLLNNVKANFDIDEVIIKPLRDIRKLRQVPAHELYSNKYDEDLYEEQKQLVESVYGALYALRRLFMGHPSAKNIKVPNSLSEQTEIVFY